MKLTTKMLSLATLGVALGCCTPANALSIAVFGNNNIDDYINTLPGYSATLVSDAQLSTAGFLNSYDAFFMTRDGSSFGSGLSAAASANVASYVGSIGNVVLLNGDFADSVPSDSTINTLVQNSVSYAAASHHGFIGEFNGTAAALTANGNGFVPIGLISGTAGALAGGGGGSGGSLYKTAVGASHVVTSSLADGYNPAAVEFGASISGVSPTLILATWGVDGEAAVIAKAGTAAAVPDAGASIGLLGIALAILGAAKRRLG